MGHGRKPRLEDTGAKLPLTMGHEIAGTVVAMGPDAKGIAVGVRGVVYPWIGCGHCARFAAGDDACETPRSLGVRADGGYSNYVLVPDGRYVVADAALDRSRPPPMPAPA